MPTVCVFCASSPGHRPVFMQCARDTGTLLARAGFDLVYGGGKLGLMGAVADATMAAGGRAIGVIPRFMCSIERDHPGLTELHMVSTMHERKALMAERADGFIALPGGFGTFDELCEIVAWSQLKLHHKPVVVVNLDGYFDGLLQQMNRGVGEGLIPRATAESMVVVTDVAAAVSHLASAIKPGRHETGNFGVV